jgi:GGDEF domain-containing protein
VISLFKSINDLEQLNALHEAAAKSLSAVIEASAHYAVELNAQSAGVFRQHLTLLASQVGKAASREDYAVIRSSFRGELRGYRDSAYESLTRLRNELKAAAAAMQSFAEGLTASADEHETQIKNELGQLKIAAGTGDPVVMCGAIDHAVQSVSQSCEEMKRVNQVVVAQLQDELRALHQEIDKERRALYTDRSTGVWNRQKIDTRIEDLMRRPDAFCVLLLGIGNLRGLHVQYSRTVIEGTLKSLLGRLANLLGDEAMIGRWSEDVFVAVLDIDPGVVEKLREQAAHKLSGSYSMQENGLARKVDIQVKVGMVEREKGAEPVTFYPKLGQIAAVVVET